MKSRSHESGVILVSAIWVIIILSLVAVSLARNSGIDASLVSHAIGRTKAYYAAVGGIMYAKNLILEDSLDAQTATLDSLYQCGLRLPEGRTPKDLMENITMGEDGRVDIIHKYREEGGILPRTVYGFEDEDRKLNLNAITSSNYSMLASLIIGLGFAKSDADVIAAAVVDWKDADEALTAPPAGAESDHYGRLDTPHVCKNRAFDHVAELRMVKGMRPEIFEKLKDYVTVYPKEPSRLTVNFNTASAPVIKAIVGYAVENVAGLSASNPQGFVDKILRFRRGPDGQTATADDRAIITSGSVQDQMNFSITEEQMYFSIVQAYHTSFSQFFRVQVDGSDRRSGVHSNIEAVIQRNPLVVVAWHRN